jgi:serine protease Do
MMDAQQKKFLAIVIIISFVTSAVAGFLAGGLANNFFASVTAPGVNNQAAQTLVVAQQEQVVNVVRDTSPAVVSIIITKNLSAIQPISPFDDFFGQFWPFDISTPSPQSDNQQQEIGGGTGFIISGDGLILTNKHVVGDGEANYTVLTNDGQKYPAKVLALDPAQDIALIKIDKNNLPILKLGDSDKIESGQTVIAIGNALGEFRNTVSVGVVSGLRRSISASAGLGQTAEQLDNVIQTDAAINPGNSGGPLLNLNGEVVGINVAMAQGAQDIGFALPINVAKRDIVQVQSSGKISYPFLGVRYVAVTPEIQQQNNLAVDYGALITAGQGQSEPAITAGSPAEQAGLEEGDIILEADGQKIDLNHSLAQAIQNYNVGDTITLKILSGNQQKDIKVVLGER